jgi:hypothetical protein
MSGGLARHEPLPEVWPGFPPTVPGGGANPSGYPFQGGEGGGGGAV